ncbi:hypothetical protein, partial [Streptomyces hundungensis]|uniref:hypothetical protein n=1 Tax=Streptomyces hundungensis TaxID=1077946 RepID=UPI003F53F674
MLVGRSLLVVSGDGYAFRHALIRQAVYEDLLPGERTRLHARHAKALHGTDAARRHPHQRPLPVLPHGRVTGSAGPSGAG